MARLARCPGFNRKPEIAEGTAEGTFPLFRYFPASNLQLTITIIDAKILFPFLW